MSNFEEEFNNCLHFGFIPNEPQNKIIEHFKYWQPPKPLVVVPRIVASYIETEEDNDFDRVGALVYGHYKAVNGGEEYYEFNEWIACNFDTFLEAIVNGYTVEKEKLYKVVFLKTGDDEILLLKSDTFFIDWISIYNYLKYQFTEKEIKDIDERYWTFAVPVEEVEPRKTQKLS